MKYRIKKITNACGTETYHIQRKIIFWFALDRDYEYLSLEDAQRVIDRMVLIKLRKKVEKVEYINYP